MNPTQLVTISFFRYSGPAGRWWAFRQMGRGVDQLSPIDGLSFVKLLGSGGGNGFSILPNWKVYGLLAAWDREEQARCFFSDHPAYRAFEKRSDESWTVFMHPVLVHGRWDEQAPFRATGSIGEEEPVGVLTRATIRTRHLLRFWKEVPRVSRTVNDKKGLLFSIGVGERPLIQQATFSLWQNSRLMEAYAYQDAHLNMVRKTRAIGWYKEELFARFRPLDSFGSWNGEKPLAGMLENLR